MNFQRPKGTQDLYQKQVIIFSKIINSLIKEAKNFNYQEIITPIIESSELFLRTMGQTTNIVEKEIYQFLDKGKRMIALRPEATAGVIRAVVENRLYSNQKQTQKYFYYGNMYRYENPQKGRNREFRQFGVEVLGTKHPLLDVEVLLLATNMLQALEIKDYCLQLNYFGSESTKLKFNHALLKALTTQKTKLCQDCQKRILKNPLRVLDCQTCQQLDLNLPVISEFYLPEENQYFQKVIAGLSDLKINFKINQYLVRGLDYYNGIIFEFTSENDVLGKSQNTLIGGGRYDNLCQQLGVPYSYPAIGFAFGIERLMLIVENNPKFSIEQNLDLLIISQYQQGIDDILILLNNLRTKKYFVDGIYDLFNDKQKSSLIKNKKDINNLLVLEDLNQATLYQLVKAKKVLLKFENQKDLLEKVIKLLS